MPTYEYECGACGHRFEKFQMMTDKVLRKCPACGKRKLERLIGTGAGIIFKGSGFYETDYKRSGTPSSSGEGSSEKKQESKSDSSSAASDSSTSSSSSSASDSSSKKD